MGERGADCALCGGTGTVKTFVPFDFKNPDGGAATGARVRKLLPGVTNMADARKAEDRIKGEVEDPESSPLVTDFLLTTYLDWARQNKAWPKIDERFVRAACGSAHFRGRTLAEFSLIQAEGYKRELRESRNRMGRLASPCSRGCAKANCSLSTSRRWTSGAG
jgi:hypothetical protein